MFDNDCNDERKFADKERELADFSEQLAFQANLEEEEQVPEWHRAAAFEHYYNDNSQQSMSWWQWRGIPMLSMACSAAAVALVLAFAPARDEFDQQAFSALLDEQVNKRVSELVNKEMTTQVDGAVAALVDLRLREFAAEQQVILANYRADMSNKQQSNNLQLASYILNASRQERKEDIGDFVSFINAQRQDEQLAQKIKFQQLEQDIGFQKLNYQLNEPFNEQSNEQPVQKKVTQTKLLEQS